MMKKLSYKRMQFSTCPNCGNKGINYGDLDASRKKLGNTNKVFYPYRCDSCGVEGGEWYELKYIGHTINSKKGGVM